MKTQNTENTGQKKRGRPRAFDKEQAMMIALDVFGQYGYEAASLSILCKAMKINPPSLYAAFGSKAALFETAVAYYKVQYLEPMWLQLKQEPDVFTAINSLFASTAEYLSDDQTTHSCLAIHIVVNTAEDSGQMLNLARELGRDSQLGFERRIQQGIEAGQLTENTDVSGLALTLKALINGMALQARDCESGAELMLIAMQASVLLDSYKAS